MWLAFGFVENDVAVPSPKFQEYSTGGVPFPVAVKLIDEPTVRGGEAAGSTAERIANAADFDFRQREEVGALKLYTNVSARAVERQRDRWAG